MPKKKPFVYSRSTKALDFYETEQSAVNGGSPVPNEWGGCSVEADGFGHGEPVYVVKKRELFALLYRCYDAAISSVAAGDRKNVRLAGEIKEILQNDKFIARGPDLPELPPKGARPRE